MPPLVVAYHAVSSAWPSDLAISEGALEAQLTLLKRRGYSGLTFVESERLRATGRLPARSVVVTFDDGYESTLRAQPILQSLGYPATVFPALRFVESNEPLRWPGIEHWSESQHAAELKPLTWAQLERLVDDGWEVGSHTVSHARLPDLSDAKLSEELEASRRAIMRRLGTCETIAYPYGEADDRVACATAAAGYVAGCTLSRFQLADSPHLRPRVGLFAEDTGAKLRMKLSRASFAVRRSRSIARLLGGG